MKGHSAGMVYRRTDTTPYVEFWEQPFLRYMIFRAYGLWERSTWRLLRKIEPLHRKMFDKGDDEDHFYIPLTNRQDLRCDHLMRKKRVSLAFVYITQEQYDIITGKTPVLKSVRHEVSKPVTIEPEPAPEGESL